MITLVKRGKEATNLQIFDHITKPAVGSKLITTLAERYQSRPGGYTRIWNAGLRKSDKAPIAIVELVDNPFDMKKAFANMKLNRDQEKVESNQL